MTKEEFILAVEDWYLTGNEDSITFLGGLFDEVTQPHWISVEDEMPPMSDEDGMSDKVLTHSKGGGIYFNRYDYGHNTWGNPYAFNVTHWMPLPQPPKKGGEQ